jgi:hypothetical protein
MRVSILSALLLICAGAAAAQPPVATPDSPRAALAAREAKRYPQPVQVGVLIGRDVLQPLEAQPILGTVDAVVRRPDGGLDMIVSFGGVLGIGSRPIAVPIEAIALLGQYVAIMDFTPDQLGAFPTDDGSAATRLPADAVIKMGLTKPFH